MIKQKSKILTLKKEQETLKDLRKYVVNLPAGYILNKKMLQRIYDIDQEQLKLIKEDQEELNILLEYNKLLDMEKKLKEKQDEIAEQKRMIQQMIENKNKEAKAQQRYIKELTKKYEKKAMEDKAKAKERAIKDVENLNDGDFLINQ